MKTITKNVLILAACILVAALAFQAGERSGIESQVLVEKDFRAKNLPIMKQDIFKAGCLQSQMLIACSLGPCHIQQFVQEQIARAHLFCEKVAMQVKDNNALKIEFCLEGRECEVY